MAEGRASEGPEGRPEPKADLHRCRCCGEVVRLLEGLRPLREVPGDCDSCGHETVFSKVGFHLPIWTIYEDPRWVSNRFTARLFLDDKPTLRTKVAPDLESLRQSLPKGLARLERMPGDDPSIVEVWL